MRPLVLYADDDSNDVLLVQRAFESSGLNVDLRVVRDGACVIGWLLGQAEYVDRDAYPIPAVIITDSKMPLKSGLEVLRWVRHHPEFKDIPVILHFGSIYFQDLAIYEALGVTACLEKKSGGRELVAKVRDVLEVRTPAEAVSTAVAA